MKNLSPEISRHVSAERANNLYLVRDRHRALLAEAKAATTNEHLSDWRPEARALVDALDARVASFDARIESFEATIPPLERAIAAENTAQGEFNRAQSLHSYGSLDRETQLRLADDLEATSAVLRIRAREREAAVSAARAGLPMTNAIDSADHIRSRVQGVAVFCVNRRFHADSSNDVIDPAAWKRLLEMSDADAMWVPLHAGQLIAEAKREAATTGGDYRRESVVLPIDDFVETLSRLQAGRAAAQRSKVAAARATLASLEGSAA